MFLTYQHVDAPVELTDRVEGGDAVVLGPVHLVVGEGLVVETADDAEDVRIVGDLLQVFPVRVQAALLLPEVRDARAVLPAVEAFEVFLDVQGA
ncbi:hypothetical protein D9M70_556100 [compost metagenome]